MPGQFNEWLRRENLWDEPSPRELEQLTASSLRSRQTIDASLQSEALQVLMWSIGAITTLQPFTELYTSGMPHALPAPGEDTAEFISHAILRSDEEIDSALNLIVDAHWQLRNEQFFPEEEAIPMNPGVVRERHWALEWIVNVGDDPWDQLQTNT